MPRRYSAREVESALAKLGFVRLHQRGSHIRLRANWRGQERNVTLVAGEQVIPPRTLSSILAQAGLKANEFRDLVAGQEVRE